ncbi:kelch-like protein 4 [Episyrphus balteatus]|uniref:kelch-like protein 4 n=1 Tax=Episyrphus balteatus TaxID=286459 RepID=UPI002485103F|nr:kelch-like protein 4 [Episyrphus balteatus]
MTTTNQIPKNDDKIIFKCDKHSTIISEKLQSFYQENELFDTVIIAGSDHVNIHAHSVVLCALSEYFLQIFRGTKRTSKDNIVELKEINASTLKLVIDFMYSGTIELSLQTVEAVLRIASFLMLNTLVDGCCELIEENIDYSNCLYWLCLAKELKLKGLQASSLEFTYIHFEKISKDKEFMILNENELKDLLFNDNPHGDFEEEVFLSMVAWINYNKLQREHLVFELLSMIRYWVLTPKFIVENRHSVCKTVENYELICSWLQWHLSPESRTNDHSKCDLKPRKKPKLTAARSFYNVDGNIQIETFNPQENSWSVEIENRFGSKKDMYSTIMMDGKLIAVGGHDSTGWKNTVKCLDLNTLEWSYLPPMINTPKQRCQLVDLKGYLCVFADGEYMKTFSMEIYNFSTRKWYEIQPICQLSEGCQIAAHNEMLYILDFKNGCLQTYDAASNKWTSRTIKTDLFKYFGLAAVEGFIYVFGGRCVDESEYVTTVKRYDLANDSWCEISSLPYLQANSFIKTKALENKIIIASDSLNVAEYDIDTDKWITMSPISKSIWFGSFDICYM